MAGSKDLPKHAYVPGVNDRHPEGAFDHIRDTVHDGMTAQELSSSAAFRSGLSYLQKGYYWEAHEVLEPVWMVLPEGCDERQLLQALIQFANAQLKVKMHRPKAAKRLCGMVRGLLCGVAGQVVMGLEIKRIAEQVDSLEQALDGVI